MLEPVRNFEAGSGFHSKVNFPEFGEQWLVSIPKANSPPSKSRDSSKPSKTVRACKDCKSTSRRLPHPGPRCGTCHRARRKEVSEARRLTYVASQYNLSPEEYRALTGRYNGMCWGCRKRKGKAVDHDHGCCSGKTSCGKCVRGFLCTICNVFLGRIGDSIQILINLIDYLREYMERNNEAICRHCGLRGRCICAHRLQRENPFCGSSSGTGKEVTQ